MLPFGGMASTFQFQIVCIQDFLGNAGDLKRAAATADSAFSFIIEQLSPTAATVFLSDPGALWLQGLIMNSCSSSFLFLLHVFISLKPHLRHFHVRIVAFSLSKGMRQNGTASFLSPFPGLLGCISHSPAIAPDQENPKQAEKPKPGGHAFHVSKPTFGFHFGIAGALTFSGAFPVFSTGRAFFPIG